MRVASRVGPCFTKQGFSRAGSRITAHEAEAARQGPRGTPGAHHQREAIEAVQRNAGSCLRSLWTLAVDIRMVAEPE